MSNRTDIVVETDNAEGQVLLSASRVYDLTEDKTQDTINGEIKNTLNQLDQNIAYVESGNTASRTYTAGDFISWKGTLYTASAAIPLGDPFAVGTNLAAVVDSNSDPCGGLNYLKNTILKEDVSTGTTTASGNLTTSISLSDRKIVLAKAAYGSNYENNSIAIISPTTLDTYNFKILNNGTMAPIASTPARVTYWYIETT